MFDYHPPILRFSPSEQRLLTFALTGVTNEQLAGALGISVSGVKKMWISIHRRIEESMPDLFGNHTRWKFLRTVVAKKSAVACWLICEIIQKSYARPPRIAPGTVPRVQGSRGQPARFLENSPSGSRGTRTKLDASQSPL